MMTLSELYSKIKNMLTAQFPDQKERGIVSRRIVGGLAGVSSDDCILHPDRCVEIDNAAVSNVIRRIHAHEPLEYILNSAQFLDIELYTNSNVLIPRPETEELVLKILCDLQLRRGQGGGGACPSAVHSISLLDVGTGSGCIPVYLATKFPDCEYHAVDVSDAALDTARRNAERHGCNIDFVKADILDYLDFKAFASPESDVCSILDSLRFDVIVSNPPYVLESEKSLMQPNVLDYEPNVALFVPDGDPLRFYRAICNFAVSHMKKGGRLYFEINERFGAQTAALMQSVGFDDVVVNKDLFGKDRFVFGRFF